MEVKCYLFLGSYNSSTNWVREAKEIRRFSIGSISYNELIDKIVTAYGFLLQDREDIMSYWQDDENEIIGFSTDQEMEYAFSVLNRIHMETPLQTYAKTLSYPLYKIYVRKKVLIPKIL